MRQFRALIWLATGALAPAPATAVECRLLSVSAPNFARLIQLEAEPVMAEGSITVECDALPGGGPINAPAGEAGVVEFTVALSPGQSGNYAVRQAIGGPRYNLYLDPGHHRVWGDGSGGSEVLSHRLELPHSGRVASPQRVVLPVFAAVEAHVQGQAGAVYSDTVQVSLGLR